MQHPPGISLPRRQRPPWADLQHDLLFIVFENVPAEARNRWLREVCKPWAKAVAELQLAGTVQLRPPAEGVEKDAERWIIKEGHRLRSVALEDSGAPPGIPPAPGANWLLGRLADAATRLQHLEIRYEGTRDDTF